MAETGKHITKLRKTLNGHRAAATFACGGQVASKLNGPQDMFMLYEDTNGEAYRINFPASQEELKALTMNCDPATFGVLKEEKLDLDYRSAWKLDNTKFLTSFHPADTDVMEMMTNLLFPPTLIGVQPFIVAELYKLNVRFLYFIPDKRSTKDRSIGSNHMLTLLVE